MYYSVLNILYSWKNICAISTVQQEIFEGAKFGIFDLLIAVC